MLAGLEFLWTSVTEDREGDTAGGPVSLLSCGQPAARRHQPGTSGTGCLVGRFLTPEIFLGQWLLGERGGMKQDAQHIRDVSEDHNQFYAAKDLKN